jgi:hypothetical protein
MSPAARSPTAASARAGRGRLPTGRLQPSSVETRVAASGGSVVATPEQGFNTELPEGSRRGPAASRGVSTRVTEKRHPGLHPPENRPPSLGDFARSRHDSDDTHATRGIGAPSPPLFPRASLAGSVRHATDSPPACAAGLPHRVRRPEQRPEHALRRLGWPRLARVDVGPAGPATHQQAAVRYLSPTRPLINDRFTETVTMERTNRPSLLRASSPAGPGCPRGASCAPSGAR